MTTAYKIKTREEAFHFGPLTSAYPVELCVKRPSEAALAEIELGRKVAWAIEDESSDYIEAEERQRHIRNIGTDAVIETAVRRLYDLEQLLESNGWKNAEVSA